VFTVTSSGGCTKKAARTDGSKPGTLANVARRQEHRDSVDDRETKRHKIDKSKSEAAVAKLKSVASPAAAAAKFEACDMCGVRHIGGMAQCVYNPQSAQYNTAFGQERRDKAFGGATQPSKLRQSVFRRVESNASGTATGGSGSSKGKGGARGARV
jgi:hypothetical protein